MRDGSGGSGRLQASKDISWPYGIRGGADKILNLRPGTETATLGAMSCLKVNGREFRFLPDDGMGSGIKQRFATPRSDVEPDLKFIRINTNPYHNTRILPSA